MKRRQEKIKNKIRILACIILYGYCQSGIETKIPLVINVISYYLKDKNKKKQRLREKDHNKKIWKKEKAVVEDDQDNGDMMMSY